MSMGLTVLRVLQWTGSAHAGLPNKRRRDAAVDSLRCVPGVPASYCGGLHWQGAPSLDCGIRYPHYDVISSKASRGRAKLLPAVYGMCAVEAGGVQQRLRMAAAQ